MLCFFTLIELNEDTKTQILSTLINDANRKNRSERSKKQEFFDINI